uniref:MULE transposase domain-containing protein n=1 Tax=Ditylenchus dipsaci TaxID=166011 RepID=A0A915CWU2_9BILA
MSKQIQEFLKRMKTRVSSAHLHRQLLTKSSILASKVVQVDATYKLNWHGFPVMIYGFSDAEQHFFATHLALVSNKNTWCYERFFEAISALYYAPEIIMGDGDTTISAATKKVWVPIQRAMCYAHVKMNLKKKLQPKVMDIAREAAA